MKALILLCTNPIDCIVLMQEVHCMGGTRHFWTLQHCTSQLSPHKKKVLEYKFQIPYKTTVVTSIT